MAEKKVNPKMAKESLTDEIDSLTIHGVPKIFTSKSYIMKIMWVLLCTASISVLVYCTVYAVETHLKHEIYLRQDRIPKHELKLPAITICNTNFFNMLTDGSNGTYPIDQEFPESCSFVDKKHFKSEINRDYFLEACSWFLSNITGSVGEYTGGHILFPKNFSFLPSIWPCVTLNRDGKMLQDGDTVRAGLKMILTFNESKRILKTVKSDIYNEERQGMYVTVHDPKIGMPGFSGISLPPGYHTTIMIQKKIIERKPHPFPSNCFDPSKANAPNVFSGKYRRANCVFSCLNLRINEQCGGILGMMRPFMKPEQFPEVIDANDISQCIYKVARETNSESCNCRLPCDEEVYETKTSRIPWPRDWEVEEIMPLINKAYFNLDSVVAAKRYLMKLTIFYEELTEFKYTEEEKYSLINVMSDFGGQMGLFIGASVLSFIEMLFLFSKFIKRCLKKRQIVAS